MRKKYVAFTIASLISITSLIGCGSASIALEENNSSPSKETESKSAEDLAKETKIKEEINTVSTSIEKSLGKFKDNTSIYYYNLENGAEYVLDGDRKYMGASMRKLPIVMSISDDIHAGKLKINDMLVFNKETDQAGGSGVLQGKKVIDPISIEYAMELSMKFSDNIAHKMLLRTASKDIGEYVTFASGKKMEDPYLSVKQMASLYKRLHENPENNPLYPKILDLLRTTEYHDRIDKYIPHDKVAHKIGDYYRFYHDSAIVYSDNPYILVVMTKDVGNLKPGGDEDTRLLDDEGEEACEYIAKMAKFLDDSLTKFHASK
ncbi:MAG: serine hydrolase [Sarcina sp.]